MSETTHEPRLKELTQADDRLPQRSLFTVTLATVATTVLVCLGCWLFTRARLAHLRPSRAWPEQTLEPGAEPYQVPRAFPVENEVARRRLDGYGWVDRQAGLVHIPIARAIDLYLRARGGAP